MSVCFGSWTKPNNHHEPTPHLCWHTFAGTFWQPQLFCLVQLSVVSWKPIIAFKNLKTGLNSARRSRSHKNQKQVSSYQTKVLHLQSSKYVSESIIELYWRNYQDSTFNHIQKEEEKRRSIIWNSIIGVILYFDVTFEHDLIIWYCTELSELSPSRYLLPSCKFVWLSVIKYGAAINLLVTTSANFSSH